jgi:hypothetical protein
MVSAIPLALSSPLSVPTSIQASSTFKIKDHFVFVEDQECTQCNSSMVKELMKKTRLFLVVETGFICYLPAS